MKAITYVTTVVEKCPREGSDVMLITLRDPDNWELPPFEAGAHLDLILGNGVKRSYSLCGDPHDRYRYTIAVKREVAGRGGSAWIHDRLRPGMEIGVSLPRCTMRLQPEAIKHIFIAGGIGITPFLSMIASLEQRQEDYELHYFFRGTPPLQTEISLRARHGKVFYYPSARSMSVDATDGWCLSSSTDEGSQSKTLNGSIPHLPTGHAIKRKSRLQDIIPDYHPGLALYCCGPTRLLDAFSALHPRWPRQQLHQEHFTGVQLGDDLHPPFQLELKRSQKTIEVASGITPLQALLEAGVDIDHSCEGGICGACKVTWCEGEPIHRDKVLSQAEREQQLILCVAGCKSQKLVLDL